MKALALLFAVAVAAIATGLVMLVVIVGGALADGPAEPQGQPPASAAAGEISPDLLAVYREAAALRCPGLPWPVLAGVGSVESAHGKIAGGRRYAISAGLGWAVSIQSSAGARGPMQFLPATWAAYGLDADGDGRANVEDPVDAIHAAAGYLCANGGGRPETLRQALWRYNHDEAYVALVLERAERYGGLGAVSPMLTVASSAGGRADVALFALRFLGVPYRWGGADPSGFDCSGLTQYVWARFGVAMPHYTVSQFRSFPRVPAGQEEPGDLVFFRGSGGEPPEHEGLYLGEGRFVDAPHTGDVVRVSALAERGDYMGAVRPGVVAGSLGLAP